MSAYDRRNYEINRKIKEDVDKNQKEYNEDEEGTPKEYSVSNIEELLAILEEVKDEEIILMLKGEYEIPYNIFLPNCKIIGEDKETTKIKGYSLIFQSTSNADIEISNITFDGTGVDRGDDGFIHLGTKANIHIHDCNFINMSGMWNCHGIRISQSSQDYKIEIDNCSFEGPNRASAYGHTNASIACFHAGIYYNIDIHNNTFNHPTGGFNVLHNAKAISFFSHSQSTKLENCKAYCNEYLGEGDSNYGITESECTSESGPIGTIAPLEEEEEEEEPKGPTEFGVTAGGLIEDEDEF